MAALLWPAAAVSATTLYSRGRDTPARLLAMHNMERARMNIAPLQWDPRLVAAAASYGPTLAGLGFLRHSPRQMRPGQRENLWMGTRDAFSPEQMVGSWIAERRDFRPGIFPNVSRTGNWEDVAHYTQVIARDTTRVGCFIQATGQWDFLICRYSPPGNIDGQTLP
ncbi:MAG: CAP domain-containing protein [Sphingomicrobium sp.]